jgi:hypothetical protein
VVTDKLAGGKTIALIVRQLPRPAHQFGGDANGIRLAIGRALGKHIPDGDKEFACDNDDRLGFGHAPCEAFELGFPVGEVPHGAPCSLDQGPTQFAAAGFGDFPGAMGLAAVMNGGAQAGIGDEIIGRRETGNVADGCQDGHGQDDAETWDLDKERELIRMSGPTGKSNNSTSLAVGPSHGQVRLARAICALGARPVTHRIVKRIAPTVPTSLRLRREIGEGDYILITRASGGFGLRLGVFVGVCFGGGKSIMNFVVHNRPSSLALCVGRL